MGRFACCPCVSSLAFGADGLWSLPHGWSLGLAVAEVRWAVASTNSISPTQGGTMTQSGTAHWLRLGYGDT